MHSENFIVIDAPIEKIFEASSNLVIWPAILPHYRSIRFLEQSRSRTVVAMAAWRRIPSLGSMGIPVQWTSQFELDRARREIRFLHLKSFTRGMRVVWTFEQLAEGVKVRIIHDLEPTFPLFRTFITEIILGRFFIHSIANQTLKHMKQYLEK